MITQERQPLMAAVLKHIERFERVVTFSCFLVLIAVVFADVVSREVVGTGNWGLPTCMT